MPFPEYPVGEEFSNCPIIETLHKTEKQLRRSHHVRREIVVGANVAAPAHLISLDVIFAIVSAAESLRLNKNVGYVRLQWQDFSIERRLKLFRKIRASLQIIGHFPCSSDFSIWNPDLHRLRHNSH